LQNYTGSELSRLDYYVHIITTKNSQRIW